MECQKEIPITKENRRNQKWEQTPQEVPRGLQWDGSDGCTDGCDGNSRSSKGTAEY